MARRKRVIWREGIFLQPQHFQQADHFFERDIASQWAFQNPFFYGLASWAIDSDALTNGILSLTSCEGMFPDGTVFSIPHEDDPPLPRSITDHFTHDQQTCTVYLALPVAAEGRPSVSAEADGTACRYRSQTCTVVDEVSGSQKKQIEMGAYAFSLLFSGENLDNYSAIQIGSLKRNASGRIELADDFVPPLVHIGGSRYLMNAVRGLLAMLLAKSATLSQGRKELVGGKATFSAAEENMFRLLQTLSTYTPLLNHYHFAPQLHPYELFKLLTQFAGALTVFSAEVSMKDLTRYDHDNLSGTFGGLLKIIRTVLEADIDAGCTAIPLDQINPSTYECRLPDTRILTTAKLYLGVSAKVGEKELIIGVAQRIKMSSRDRLDLLISSAMPGLPLIHVAHPPEGLSTKPGFQYFALDQQGQFWRSVQSAGSIAFYFPNNYPELKLEMLALRQ